MVEQISFSPDALSFLSDLKANNEREWFAAHRKIYEAEVKNPTKRFGVEMADAISELTGQPHNHKIYRIHRDVRFSKDKTPYNTHIHLSFAPMDDGPNEPMWFFGLSPEALSLGCGVFGFDKSGLRIFRNLMSGAKGRELIALTSELRSGGVRVSEPELKRVPTGFDKQHPNEEALRRKGFAGWLDIENVAFVTEPALVQRTIVKMRDLMPVHRLLCSLF